MSKPDRKIRRSSTTELQGLDVVPGSETNFAALSPVSPNSNKSRSDAAMEIEGEVKEIEQMEARVEELEEQLKREESEEKVPMVADVDQPTQAEVDRHEATHTHRRSRGVRHATKDQRSVISTGEKPIAGTKQRRSAVLKHLTRELPSTAWIT